MARVFLVIAGVVASSMGCAQLAGIDDTNGKGRVGNSLTVMRMSIGSRVESKELELTGLQAAYLVPTDTAGTFTHVVAGVSAPGTWSLDLPTPTAIEFTLPDIPTPIPRIFAFPNQALSVLFAPLEHPNRTPAPDGAMLTVTTPLDPLVPSTANDSFQAYTVGSWTQRALVAGAIGLTQIGPIAYAFNTSSSLSGRPTFDRLTTQDAFLVLRYTGAALTGVAEASPFDQTGTDTVTTPMMMAVVQDQTLDLKIKPPDLATRYAAVRPNVATLAMNWNLVAAPGYRIASNTGPLLQSGSVALTDTTVPPVKYGNPFAARNWNTIFTLGTSESRVATPMGPTLPVTLFAGMNQFIEPTTGFALTLPAGLPVLISIDGKQLSTDGQTITPPSKFVEVTFIPDNANATLFNLQVYDLVPNAAATGLEFRLVFAAASNEAKFAVPPEVFQTGHSYTLRALCTYEGYPAIASGDFTQRQLPLSQSYLDSGVFTVMP